MVHLVGGTVAICWLSTHCCQRVDHLGHHGSLPCCLDAGPVGRHKRTENPSKGLGRLGRGSVVCLVGENSARFVPGARGLQVEPRAGLSPYTPPAAFTGTPAGIPTPTVSSPLSVSARAQMEHGHERDAIGAGARTADRVQVRQPVHDHQVGDSESSGELFRGKRVERPWTYADVRMSMRSRFRSLLLSWPARSGGQCE